ncbi:hypothetical protein [Gracilibacillus suaedae]|uniref:hypothetical protein n=1 Tax=Gracilibacillus suaedae TaxID=2820273 RepID=UPI001ABEC888|nr:hypothetical protein [Gracilibacillus suaedae]
MKKILLITTLLILLVACSPNQVNGDAASLYKTEDPAQISLDLPDELTSKEETHIEIDVHQAVAEISASLWKQGEENDSVNLDITKMENETYLMKHTFREDGIYYLQIRAETSESKIMPTKRLIVGDLSKEEQELLEQESDHTDHDGHDHSDHH